MAWLLRETFEPQQLTASSIFDGSAPNQCVVEVGPRTNFSTAFSTNATSITRSVGLDKVTRLEPSRRYLLTSTRCVAKRGLLYPACMLSSVFRLVCCV
jgi:phosphoribosylformylglycinamidine synthase